MYSPGVGVSLGLIEATDPIEENKRRLSGGEHERKLVRILELRKNR